MYANDKMGIIGDIFYCGVYFQFTLILSVSTFILHWCLVSTFILHWYLQFLLSFYIDTYSFYFHFTVILSISIFIIHWYFQFLLSFYSDSFYIDTFTFYFHFTLMLSLCTFILQWYFHFVLSFYSDTLEFVLTNLEPYTLYSIRVRSHTLHDHGIFSDAVDVRTREDGRFCVVKVLTRKISPVFRILIVPSYSWNIVEGNINTTKIKKLTIISNSISP